VKIAHLTNPPVWWQNGEILDEKTHEEVNKTAQWYFLIVKAHGSPVEDARMVWTAPNWAWKRCETPIAAIWPREFRHQDPARLESVRKGPSEAIPPIIGEFFSDGTVRLLDGGHRITVVREENRSEIVAFIGNPLFWTQSDETS
jgi:hypothetical protein